MELPPEQTGPNAWTAKDLEVDTASWSFRLSDAGVGELEAAAEVLASRTSNGTQLHSLAASDASMPMLSGWLQIISEALLHGRGVALLRGLPVEKYSESEISAMFAAIGLHLGSLRPQNATGDLIGHVRDIGADLSDPATRIYQTNERQTFHTDSSDAVALLCMQRSRTGGESLVVSANAIYNAMLRTRPDLLARLFDPVPTDRRGEIPDGQLPWFEIPVFSWFDDQLTVMYQRQYIDSASRFPDATQPDDEQVEAMDLFDELANDPDLFVSMAFEPGDIQFVNNHSLLHDRMGFTDWPDAERRRHLLRLWLSMPGDRQLPEVFTQRYGSTSVGDRGGIVTAR